MYCQVCGARVDDHVSFCVSCGTPLRPVQQQGVAAPAQQQQYVQVQVRPQQQAASVQDYAAQVGNLAQEALTPHPQGTLAYPWNCVIVALLMLDVLLSVVSMIFFSAGAMRIVNVLVCLVTSALVLVEPKGVDRLLAIAPGVDGLIGLLLTLINLPYMAGAGAFSVLTTILEMAVDCIFVGIFIAICLDVFKERSLGRLLMCVVGGLEILLVGINSVMGYVQSTQMLASVDLYNPNTGPSYILTFLRSMGYVVAIIMIGYLLEKSREAIVAMWVQPAATQNPYGGTGR